MTKRHAAALFFLTQQVCYAYYFYFDIGVSETLLMFRYICHNILRFPLYIHQWDRLTLYTGSYRISLSQHV